MEMAAPRIAPDSVVTEVLERNPQTGPILIQRGRMFRAPTGHLYVEYPRLTVEQYAALNGLDLQQLLRALNAAAEPGDLTPPAHESPPADALRRGAAIGYTGAYHEPADVEVQDVVTAQTRRGPD